MKLNQKSFNKILDKNFIFENYPTVAVAVSGGPDSIGLLFLLNEWIKERKGKIIALIVDHKLRGNSFYEANLVGKYLKANNYNFKILSVRKKQIKKRSMNEARINRYKLITDYCVRNKILHLFVAHHNDDNLETFLIRKVSGSDFDGLSSIKMISKINKTIILRPLLNFTKKEILEFNKKRKIEYVIDPSNTNLNYTRPSIRNFLDLTPKKNLVVILKEFQKIKDNLFLYKRMISEILIYGIVEIDKKYIKIKNEYLIKQDSLISEKIIKKVYFFFYYEKFFLRSKKIQILIKELKKKNFKVFNLGGMLVKKSDNSLVFSKKAN